jgi:poly(3-hydroxybutyrate) depolymerase
VRRALALLVVALIAGCGGPDEPPGGLKVEDLTVKSRAVGKDMAVKVVVPPGGADGKPLLVFLHGRSGDESSYLHEPPYNAVKALGDRAPVIASRSPTATTTSIRTTATAATGAAMSPPT